MTQPSKFEAAALDYAYFPGCDGINGPGEPPSTDESKYRAFKAGADWQAKQILELLRSAEYGTGFGYDVSYAADWLEQKMKEGAV